MGSLLEAPNILTMNAILATAGLFFASIASALSLERVIVSADGKGFALAESKKPFVPWGVNYGNTGRLMDDFWDTEWDTLEGDFAEVKAMGGNVIRVHLQF